MGRAARLRKVSADRVRPVAAGDLYRTALEALSAKNEPAALVLLQQTLLLDETHELARYNLATALLAQGARREAIEHYRILAERPQPRTEVLINLAEALRRQGDNGDAEAIADRLIAAETDHSTAYLIRGAARFELGMFEQALVDLHQAIALEGSASAGHKLLGKVLLAMARKSEALDALRSAIIADPNDGEAHRLLADLLDRLGLLADAFIAYRRAIEVDPLDLYGYANLSGLLCKTKLLDVALSVADVGIRLAPDLSQLHYNRGMALEKLDRSAEALASYGEALRRDPQSGQALLSVCRLKDHLCDWHELEALRARARQCSFEAGRPAAPFSVVTASSSLSDILLCNEVWSRSIEAGSGSLTSYTPRCRPAERLRIGYISADFHGHATAQLIAELFEHHDRARFETFGYSIGATDDGAMRQRLVAGLEHFHDMSEIGYDEAAALIRAHGIDILVDLKGYTYQARTEILTRRPAPIQVNFLGYPSTMGAPFIDYIIGDRIVTPFEHAPFYSEALVQLPHCYQPNDRKREMAAAPTRAAENLPDQAFVFSCLNAAYKITPPVFDVWMDLLLEIEGAVLWLYAKNETVRSNLRREASARRVDPARLVLADKRPAAEHLARMALGDLFLDTSPCGAHTTASEALWAGLPMLTILGPTFAARVGASLLNAVGLPELVATSLEDYRSKALALAGAPAELIALRRRLLEARQTAPLFDSASYTHDLENAFARMAAMRDAGEAPRSFSV